MSEVILRRETLDRSKIAELPEASSAEAGAAIAKNSLAPLPGLFVEAGVEPVRRIHIKYIP